MQVKVQMCSHWKWHVQNFAEFLQVFHRIWIVSEMGPGNIIHISICNDMRINNLQEMESVKLEMEGLKKDVGNCAEEMENLEANIKTQEEQLEKMKENQTATKVRKMSALVELDLL